MTTLANSFRSDVARFAKRDYMPLKTTSPFHTIVEDESNDRVIYVVSSESTTLEQLEFIVLKSATSTAQKNVPSQEAHEALKRLFAADREEVFEDGVESEFSRNLLSLVDRYGNEAIEVLYNLIVGEQVNAEVASEALRWLGQMDNPLTHHQRLWLLERSLNHSSARVRDGAALGIAFLDDPRAIPYVERAIHQEGVSELREDMQQVLEQLTETSLESSS